MFLRDPAPLDLSSLKCLRNLVFDVYNRDITTTVRWICRIIKTLPPGNTIETVEFLLRGQPQLMPMNILDDPSDGWLGIDNFLAMSDYHPCLRDVSIRFVSQNGQYKGVIFVLLPRLHMKGHFRLYAGSHLVLSAQNWKDVIGIEGSDWRNPFKMVVVPPSKGY